LVYIDEDGMTNNITIDALVSQVEDNNTATEVKVIATHTNGNGDVQVIEETVTSLIDNGDGTFTYTDENGDPFTFGAAETITTLVDNGDGTFTYTSEDGTETTYDETTTIFVILLIIAKL